VDNCLNAPGSYGSGATHMNFPTGGNSAKVWSMIFFWKFWNGSGFCYSGYRPETGYYSRLNRLARSNREAHNHYYHHILQPHCQPSLHWKARLLPAQ